MAMAYLGFDDGGPTLSFRINPDLIEWDFKANTRVFHTIGGRVIQVLGGTLGDMRIYGSFGEDRTKRYNGEPNGESWKLQKAFVSKIQEMMSWQSRDATIHRQFSEKMHKPARFVYSPRGWNFEVYIRSIADPDGGGSANIRTGKFSHKYLLTLFIVEAGSSNIRQIKSKGVNDYIDRISDGIGWKYSKYNGTGWENLDPYSENWGEALDLSSIVDDATNPQTGATGPQANESGNELGGPGNNAQIQ